jgi:hypothetical protein
MRVLPTRYNSEDPAQAFVASEGADHNQLRS